MSAATDLIMGRQPFAGSEIPVKNTTGGGTKLTAGMLVKIDAAHAMSASQPIDGVIATSGVTDFPFGILVEDIPDGQIGRCQIGGIAVGIALGAITAGAIVGASATAGQVTTYTATDPSVGQALTAATAAGDPIRIRIAVSRNA